MTDKLLEIDVRLLLLRHGRKGVLEALARLEGRTIEDLDRELLAAEQKPKKKRQQPDIDDVVAAECQ